MRLGLTEEMQELAAERRASAEMLIDPLILLQPQTGSKRLHVGHDTVPGKLHRPLDD